MILQGFYQEKASNHLIKWEQIYPQSLLHPLQAHVLGVWSTYQCYYNVKHVKIGNIDIVIIHQHSIYTSDSISWWVLKVKKKLGSNKKESVWRISFFIDIWAQALEYLQVWIDNGKLYFYIQSTTMAEEGGWDV